MRVPRPDLLKLTKESLLEDVRERLGEKYPDYKEESEYDATDPAWVILEQAAWLVELLSEQLDRYPYSMVQELDESFDALLMMGYHSMAGHGGNPLAHRCRLPK